jgi:PAS domain S-box-containing protein
MQDQSDIPTPQPADKKRKLVESFLSINSQHSVVVTCVFLDYKIVDGNPSFLRHFRREATPSGEEDIRNLIHPDDLELFTHNCENSRENFQKMVRFLTNQGQSLTLFTYLIHFQLNERTYHCLIGYEQNPYQGTLNDPSLVLGQMETTFADMLTEIVEISTSDFKYAYVNERGCAFFGKALDELTGMSTLDTIYEEDVAMAVKIMAPVMNGFAETFDMDIRSIRGDGALVWMNFTGRPIIDETGAVVGYFSVGRDISSTKMAEANWKYLNAQLEEKVQERTRDLEEVNRKLSAMHDNIYAVFMSMPAEVLVIDETGTLLMRNNYLTRTWGVTLDLIAGCLSQDVRNGKNPHLRRLFTEQRSFRDVEFSFSLSDCREISCFVSGVLLEQNDTDPKSAIIILRSSQEVHGLASRISGNKARFQFTDIITANSKMTRTKEIARRAASDMGNVLIVGESGTGKELLAQSIHNHSERRNGPFIGVNCGAIPRELIASELFGYADGAFTGSRKGGNPGKFELARGGTVFLDEIGDMPLEQQVVLLRVLQEKSLTKVGGSRPIPVDCRIICATNVNLQQETEKNNFRKDLFYRLNVIPLHIPPLRERPEDILLLLSHFIEKLAVGRGRSPLVLPQEFLSCLSAYAWPGNIRELQNVVERLYYLSRETPLTLADLPEEILHTRQTAGEEGKPPSVGADSIGKMLSGEKKARKAAWRRKAVELLRRHDGNISRAARELGIARSTLYAWMKGSADVFF